MKYNVLFEKRILKDLKKVPKILTRQILLAIDLLSTNPLPVQSRKLAGYTNVYRIRIGNYRVLYSIEKEVKIIYIQRIAHRKDAYQQQMHLRRI